MTGKNGAASRGFILLKWRTPRDLVDHNLQDSPRFFLKFLLDTKYIWHVCIFLTKFLDFSLQNVRKIKISAKLLLWVKLWSVSFFIAIPFFCERFEKAIANRLHRYSYYVKISNKPYMLFGC